MYTYLAPNLTSWINNVWILWFETSNRYILVDSRNYALLEVFFTSKNEADFLNSLVEQKLFSKKESLAIYNELEALITECNQPVIYDSDLIFKFDSQKQRVSKSYTIYGKTIQINFDSDIVMSLIHPSLAHLESDTKNIPESTFDIYIENDMLCLFLDRKLINSYPKKSYHLLQGKFIMNLLCLLYDNQEQDWLGVFHASTISNGKEAVMCIGKSGSGKSTLAALLMASGYELVSDDVTPIQSENTFVYSYPGAISVKKGAFKSLAPLINNFDKLPSHFINNSKSSVKYVPPTHIDNSKKYACKNVVLINYLKDSKTLLENLELKDALQILITDSWISPDKQHAKIFMEWVSEISFYRLNYSNSDEAIVEFSNLFD